MSWYNDIVSWLDTVIIRNGRNAITGTHANKMGKDLAAYTKSVEDKLLQSDWNQEDDTKLDYIKNKPASTTQDVTRHEGEFSISGGVLTLDFNNKNELIATKVGGGGIPASANFSIAFDNDNSAKLCQGFLDVLTPVSISLPAGTVTANALELEAGEYQFVFSNDGAKWHFAISETETTI